MGTTIHPPTGGSTTSVRVAGTFHHAPKPDTAGVPKNRRQRVFSVKSERVKHTAHKCTEASRTCPIINRRSRVAMKLVPLRLFYSEYHIYIQPRSSASPNTQRARETHQQHTLRRIQQHASKTVVHLVDIAYTSLRDRLSKTVSGANGTHALTLHGARLNVCHMQVRCLPCDGLPKLRNPQPGPGDTPLPPQSGHLREASAGIRAAYARGISQQSDSTGGLGALVVKRSYSRL